MHEDDVGDHVDFKLLHDRFLCDNVALIETKMFVRGWLIVILLTQQMRMCCRLTEMSSSFTLSSSHSGYQLAQNKMTMTLSPCLSLNCSICCNEVSFIRIFLSFEVGSLVSVLAPYVYLRLIDGLGNLRFFGLATCCGL